MRCLDNLRSPPGLFQILETVNKLNKTSDQLMSDFIKHLKQTGLIIFDKYQKNKVGLQHSFGLVQYSCEQFVEQNKGGINMCYKELFTKQKLDFLERHDFSFESVNKWYKSDIYRTRINAFFQELKFADEYFLICVDFNVKETAQVICEIKTYAIESLISDGMKKYAVRITYQEFSRMFIELVSHKIKELDFEQVNFKELAKKILELARIKIEEDEILFGTSKIFMKGEVYSGLANRLREYRGLLTKWEGYLVIKMRNFLVYTKRKKFIREIRQKKSAAICVLGDFVGRYFYGSRFRMYLKIVRRIQFNFKTRKVLRMVLNTVKIIRRVKWLVVGFIAKFRFKKIIKVVKRLQVIFRRGLACRHTRNVVFARKITLKVIEQVLKIAETKRVEKCKRKVAEFVYSRYFFKANDLFFSEFRRNLMQKLLEKQVGKIQKIVRGFLAKKKYIKLRKAVIFVQKNMKRFMWRKNYLKLKSGIIKIQKIWKEKWKLKKALKSDPLVFENNYSSQINNFLEKNLSCLKKRLQKKTEENETGKLFSKPEKMIFFSYVIDVEVTEKSQNNTTSLFAFFDQLNEKLAISGNEIIDFQLCDSYFWAFDNNSDSFCSTGTIFLKQENGEKTDKKIGVCKKNELNEKNEIVKLEFHGSKPNQINSGFDSTILYYRNFNELKFLGNFDFYGENEIVRKKSGNLTVRFNEDFKVVRSAACLNTFGILSETGEAICWPFQDSGKKYLTRVHLKLKDKIVDIACGESFVGMRSSTGKVLVLTQKNQFGELGKGDFINSNKIEYVKFFVEAEIHVSQIGAGLRHLIVITKEGHLYGWGSNFHGQVGPLPYTSLPTPRRILFKEASNAYSRVVKVTAGRNTSVFILKNRKVSLEGFLDGE